METGRVSSKMMLTEDIGASCLSAGFILKVHFQYLSFSSFLRFLAC